MSKSKVDKDLKNAELALERARGRGADQSEIVELEKALNKARMRKDLARAQHFGRA